MHNFIAKPDELAGKTILVTGAGDGIGRQAAISFAAAGATASCGVGFAASAAAWISTSFMAVSFFARGIDAAGRSRGGI